MRPRFDITHRHSPPHYSQSRYSMEFISSDRYSETAQNLPAGRSHFGETEPPTEAKSTIAKDELNGFALTCIEKLAFPENGNSGKSRSVEDIIASVMIDKLPSYTKLKATLTATTTAYREDPLELSSLETDIDQLQTEVDHMQNAITRHLIQTGEEIGLPKPLLIKLADLTRAILSRYAA